MDLLKFELLEKAGGIVHFISTRLGGVSEGKFASFNLSTKVNDNSLKVSRNKQLLADELNISIEKIFFPEQCHSHYIQHVNSSSSALDFKDRDGLITNEIGMAICIMTADCVPVLLYDPVKRAVASVHAGWRGTYKRIVCRAVEYLVKKFNSKPRDILTGIGPSISQEYYEVGSDVSTHFQILFSDKPQVIHKNILTSKDHIDLKKANSILLQRSGILKEHIEISPFCTFYNKELFYSARRDGLETGRFATGIMLI